MIFAIIYAIGFVLAFVGLSIYAFIITRDDIFHDVEFGPILGYSIVWPLTLLFVLIGVIFGKDNNII